MKCTQNFRLYQLLKAASGVVSKTNVAKELEVSLASVPVYIHEFKKAFKAEITSVREGRNVVGYILVTKNLKVPEFRRNAAGIAPKSSKGGVKAKQKALQPGLGKGDTLVPVLSQEAVELSESEINDVKAALGIGGHSAGSRSSDY